MSNWQTEVPSGETTQILANQEIEIYVLDKAGNVSGSKAPFVCNKPISFSVTETEFSVECTTPGLEISATVNRYSGSYVYRYVKNGKGLELHGECEHFEKKF